MSFTTKKTLKTVLLIILFFSATGLITVNAQLPNIYKQVTSVDAYVHYDFDEDGMHNWWELLYGLDPLDPNDAPLDLDGDELTNLVEFNYLTNPLKRDTDGGGVWDNIEIGECHNPRDDPSDDFRKSSCISEDPEPPFDYRGDSDGDGLSNLKEDELGTNRQSVDTDGDGLNDYDEVYKYPTNPLEPDTDFDGINDYDELRTYFTNPTNRDSDFDGLTDYEELFTYGTNPSYWDSDDGGLSDRDEITNGSNPNKGEDDYQLTCSLFFGSEPNDIYKSLNDNKINIYQGMDLTLELIKPIDAKQITVGFNSKKFTTQEDYIKIKLLSPKKPGIYRLDITLDLKVDKTVVVSKFVEVRQRGAIISRIDGTFNSVYADNKYFESAPVEGAKIEVFEYNELSGEMQLFQADIPSQENQMITFNNPQYTDAKGTYLLPLKPGNYLIKISKPKYGSKELLFETDVPTVYSQDVYLTYSYDAFVWGGIFISTFTGVWLSINLVSFLKKITVKLSKRLFKHRGVY